MGLVTGFAMGWVVSAVVSRRDVPETAPSPPSADVLPRAPAPDLPKPPTPPPRPDMSETIRSGPLERIWRIVNDGEREYTAAEIAALIALVDRSRRERDKGLFTAAVTGLGRARTDAAQTKLLALMADESLTIPTHGIPFWRGLRESRLPGIRDAALRRFERNQEEGEDSWRWLRLVAQHGTEADLEWLFELATKGKGGMEHEAADALVSATSPPAVERAVRLIREGKASTNVLHTFLRKHPRQACTLLAELIERRSPPPGMSLPELLCSYGEYAPAERLEEARAFLLGLRDPCTQIAAVYAVQRLRYRGLSTEGLEPVVLAPIVLLETATPETDPNLASRARYTIDGNSVTWCEQAAAALEFAATVFPESSMTKSMPEIAKKIRADLVSPWRE